MMSPIDPYRFDDRAGHYGSGQADLAPVSPLAALPRQVEDVLPLDPMGAPPSERQGSDERFDFDGPNDRAAAQANARSDSQTSAGAQAGSVSVQTDAGAPIATMASTSLPQASVRDEVAPPQTVLLQSQADVRIETDVRTDTPIMSGGTPVDLLTEALPDMAAAPGDFSDMAARMDQMMAQMTSRLESPFPGSAPDEDADTIDTGPLADAQDRLDDLFGALGDRIGDEVAADVEDGSDPFGAARNRLDDLAGGLGSPRDGAADDNPGRLAEAAARLDALNPSLGRADQDDEDAPTPLGASLLARMFDGDTAPDQDPAGDRISELLDGLGDLSLGPATAGFEPGRWDDLPDFG